MGRYEQGLQDFFPEAETDARRIEVKLGGGARVEISAIAVKTH